jgi:hypothetical protein
MNAACPIGHITNSIGYMTNNISYCKSFLGFWQLDGNMPKIGPARLLLFGPSFYKFPNARLTLKIQFSFIK